LTVLAVKNGLEIVRTRFCKWLHPISQISLSYLES